MRMTWRLTSHSGASRITACWVAGTGRGAGRRGSRTRARGQAGHDSGGSRGSKAAGSACAVAGRLQESRRPTALAGIECQPTSVCSTNNSCDSPQSIDASTSRHTCRPWNQYGVKLVSRPICWSAAAAQAAGVGASSRARLRAGGGAGRATLANLFCAQASQAGRRQQVKCSSAARRPARHQPPSNSVLKQRSKRLSNSVQTQPQRPSKFPVTRSPDRAPDLGHLGGHKHGALVLHPHPQRRVLGVQGAGEGVHKRLASRVHCNAKQGGLMGGCAGLVQQHVFEFSFFRALLS